jgi:hypothetical protein
MTTAKRKLSEFDFSKKGCHISLVGPSLGGPANGVTTLVVKSLSPTGATKDPNGEGNEMSKEMIEKSAVEAMVTKAVEEAVKAVQGKADAAIAELTALKAANVNQVQAVRKSKLAAVVGDAQAEATIVAIKDLDEAAFETVLKGFEAAKSVEGKGALFTEKGVDGKADLKKVTEDAESNGVMDYLKSKYAPK